jgi:putative phosphonate metabolism protein
MAHRYAIYWAPKPGSGLHDFGAAWLGRDPVSGAELSPPGGLDAEMWRAATADPRLYGFHGTLKPPFRTDDSDGLLAALDTFAAARSPFDIPPLKLARLARFIALIPSAPAPALMTLADDCVRDFDRFRLPAPPDELAKRRAAGLTPRQDEYLLRWGYPYVLEEFRFHLTLTGKLDTPTGDTVEMLLAPQTAPFCVAPLRIEAVTLFEQETPGAPMRVTRRFRFTQNEGAAA